MRRVMWGLVFSIFTYVLVLSLGHSYYLTQINKQLEITIQELVIRISEIQSHSAWDNLYKDKK